MRLSLIFNRRSLAVCKLLSTQLGPYCCLGRSRLLSPPRAFLRPVYARRRKASRAELHTASIQEPVSWIRPLNPVVVLPVVFAPRRAVPESDEMALRSSEMDWPWPPGVSSSNWPAVIGPLSSV